MMTTRVVHGVVTGTRMMNGIHATGWKKWKTSGTMMMTGTAMVVTVMVPMVATLHTVVAMLLHTVVVMLLHTVVVMLLMAATRTMATK